jgi:hypothetical protein
MFYRQESFRLYRQKAKEIFLAQQQGGTGFIPSLHDVGSEGAKLSYLKNLMVSCERFGFMVEFVFKTSFTPVPSFF